MKRRPRLIILVIGMMLCAALPLGASPGHNKKLAKERKQILVYAQRHGNAIEYVHSGQHYSDKELDYLLGEWHVDATKDSEIVVVLEDNLLLSDVKDAPAMALKAGFTDVRAFVYWKSTGNMAEVWFGPVVKLKKSGALD